MRMRVLAAAAVAIFAAPALASAAPAPDQDGTWTAWYGCWRAMGELDGPMVCVLPTDVPTSVRVVTVAAEGEITRETTVHADGTSRPVEEGGCTGTERAWFSNDGLRVFTRAELNCSGMQRVSTGVMAMISEVAWVDAQSMKVGAEHAGRSVQYRAVVQRNVPEAIAALLPRDQEMAQEAARLNAAAPLDVADVIEMSRAIDAPAAEAMLAARGNGFGLNGAKLVQLADAGVPGSTIDMMVALSNPKKFAVATPADEEPMLEERRGPVVTADRYRCDYAGYYDYRFGHPCDDLRYYGRYGISRYGYGYGYSPYGYDPYYWRYNRPVVVIVRPSDPDGEGTRGEVVKGRGYTRTAGAGRGTAVPRDPSPSSTTTTGSSTSSSTTKSEPSSPPATRTAKPRGGGGGN